jgi:tetratricopeptide (TPR) repeat protein
MLHRSLVFSLVGLLLAAAPAAAQRLKPTPDLATTYDEIQRYQQCLQLAEKKPEDGFEAAMQWRDSTGSNAAKQCVAVALFYLDEPEEAATRLEDLALEMRAAAPELRARILSQAGTAWSVANQPERANAAITTAIQMAPNLPDLYVDRSMVLAQAKNYWEAIDDLNKALDLQPGYGIALAFRAAAYRYVDSLDLAQQDAEQAVRVAPEIPEGWLERGIIRRLKGDLKGARADWLQVLVLDPDGAAGDTARANIERLELHLDDAPANLPPQPRG